MNYTVRRLSACLIALLGSTLPAAAAGWQIQTLPGGSVSYDGVKYVYPRGARLAIYRPRRPKQRLLILLHGWNQSLRHWQRHTRVARLAERYGVTLVAPDMGKSNYMTRYYPQTKTRWWSIPGTPWVGKVLLPRLKQQYPDSKLYIAGVSTGARGALMVAEHFPRFQGVGYMSGDFDICVLNDRLSIASYGPLARYRRRWERDNTRRLAQRLLGMRVFAAHALDDTVSPAAQTRLMQKELQRLNVQARFVFDPRGGHGWKYWDSRLKAMFRWWFGGK